MRQEVDLCRIHKIGKSQIGEIVIVDLRYSHKSDVESCARRNVHGVNLKALTHVESVGRRQTKIQVLVHAPCREAPEIAALLRGLIGSHKRQSYQYSSLGDGNLHDSPRFIE